MLTDLMLLAAAAGARLWVVTSPPVTESLTTTLSDWCATEVTVAEAAAQWPGLTGERTRSMPRGGNQHHGPAIRRRAERAAASAVRRRHHAAGGQPTPAP